MRLFLDTSVLLAASGSVAGASREIFRRASANGWLLVYGLLVLKPGVFLERERASGRLH